MPPSASPDEIRRAYRSLSKIVHPDLQPSGPARTEAEARMRRLNHIWSVLGDPEQRRQYDDAVLPLPEFPYAGAVRSPASLWFEAVQMPLFLMVSAVLFVAAGYLFLHYESGGLLFEQPTTTGFEHGGGDDEPPPPLAAEFQTGSDEPEKPRTARPPKERQRQGEPAPPVRPPVAGPRTVAPIEPAGPQPVQPATSAAAAPERKPEQKPDPAAPKAEEKPSGKEESKQQQSPPPDLDGIWLLAPVRRVPGDEKLYPPKYIELRIYTEEGQIFGRYRGNYEVHDQPISANVNFTFRGKPTPPLTKLKWTGPGGSHGEVELKLTSPRTLRVDWKTENTGPGLDLVSGTATLVRREN